MKQNMSYFFKIGSNKNVSYRVAYIIKFIWFKPGDTGVNLGTPLLYKDTGIHKVFDSIVLSGMLKY